jgi:hypothetical protein
MDANKNRYGSGGTGGERCFLMLEPAGMRDSGAIARRIARCDGVKEVHLTSGRYGFVVAANASQGNSIGEISTYVKRVSGAKCMNVAVSHMVYR